MKRTLISAAALLALAPAFGATTRYCDCQTAEGSMTGCVASSGDGNPGTAASPKKTLSDAQNTINSAATGDSILFCKGGAWNADTPLTIKNTGISGAGITIDSYVSPNWTTYTDSGTWSSVGSNTLTDSTKSWTTNQFAGHGLRTVDQNGAALYMPIASNTATVLTFTEAWRLQPQVATAYTIEAPRPKLSSNAANSGIVQFTGGTAPGTPNGPYLFQNITINGKGSTDGSNHGVFMNRSVHDLTFNNVDIRGVGGVGVYFGDANYESGGTKNIAFLNGQVYDTGDQGALGGSYYQRIEGSSFDNCGFDTTGNGNHCIYLSNDFDVASAYGNGYVIRRNTLTKNSNSGSGCQSVSMVFHGVIRSLLIEDNLLYETPANFGGGCYGIAVHSGYTNFEGFEGVVIRGNTIVNMPLAIGATAAPNILIENNNIHFDVNNGFYGGIVLPINNSGAITSGDTADTSATIRNNTIYIKQGTASTAAINFGEFNLTPGSGVKVSNNLVFIGSSVNATHSCNVLGTLSLSNFTVFNHNLCYHQGANGRWGRSSDTNSYATLANAQAAGFDVNGSSSDPLFAATPSQANNWSCALQSGSPAVDAGNTTYKAPLAFGGKKAINARDIGACER